MSEIRKLPAQETRVETGPGQFGDDWPGVFIRGDQAGYYGMLLQMAMDGVSMPAIYKMQLRSLAKELQGSQVK